MIKNNPKGEKGKGEREGGRQEAGEEGRGREREREKAVLSQNFRKAKELYFWIEEYNKVGLQMDRFVHNFLKEDAKLIFPTLEPGDYLNS